MPYNAQHVAMDVPFEAVCHLLDSARTSRAVAALEMERLQSAYTLLDRLTCQYIHESIQTVRVSSVPAWYHKLLYTWCARLPLPPDDRVITSADVSAVGPEIWAELGLTERCGPRFMDALTGTVTPQDVLFPGGSMEVVRPVYEHALGNVFYNACIVAAVEAILELLPEERQLAALEVGAGSGGTASSVLPVVRGACERYVFTDVSEVFLRQARVRFAEFSFLECALLNIDADPRLQGFSLRQYDAIVATNCLHATPFMRNTLRNCEQLLRKGGVLVANDLLSTTGLAQISFGMTDGWWLFAEVQDLERIGQGSPLLSWRQWQALLFDSGFESTHCTQGDSFLRSQAILLAQTTAGSETGARVTRDDGAHFISGGLGGLGLLTARLLIEDGAPHVILSSRSGRVVAGSELDWAWLANCGGDVRRVQTDASDDVAVGAVVRALCGDRLHLGGIFHAAHQLADALLAKQMALNFRATYGPKVHGATSLHAVSCQARLCYFNVFSSMAGLMGSPAQASHSAANAWLDAMVGCRHGRGVFGQSINWGAVAEIGFAARAGADRRADLSGGGAISRSMASAALNSTLHLACRCFAVLPADWSKILADGSKVRGFVTPYSHLRGNVKVKASTTDVVAHPVSTASLTVSLDAVLEMVRDIAGGLVEADAPLMEAGVDSLGAVELRNQLQQLAMDGVELPSTLTLDYPTARRIAEFLSPSAAINGIAPTLSSMAGGSMLEACVKATAGRVPDGANDARGLLHQAACSVDAMTYASFRWPKSDSHDGSPFYSGLVHNAQQFDSQAFLLSSAEVIAMDPQQRLLLEEGYMALHSGGLSRLVSSEHLTGVFLGVDKCEWPLVRPDSAHGAYAMTGCDNSVGAGRMSFTLDLRGPAITYDTDCSAALVAMHGALRAYQCFESSACLALGVNMLLSPLSHMGFATAGILSLVGRSHTFDSRADGMGRGETCCAMLILRDDAYPENIRIRVANAAVRQDGRSASLTAPNGPAQQELFAALASTACRSVAWCETHGTGTKLGDPIEVGSLRSAAATFALRIDGGVSLGALKASTGHTEGGSGLPGLVKTAMVLSSRAIPPNAQLRRLNPHVGQALAGEAFALPTHMCALRNSSEVATGLTNAFGFSGTIAACILKVERDRMSPSGAVLQDQPVLGCAILPFGAGSARASRRYRRRAFPWRDATHLLAQHSLPAATRLSTIDPCWHYEIQWLRVTEHDLSPVENVNILAIGSLLPFDMFKDCVTIHETEPHLSQVGSGKLLSDRWHAVIFTASLQREASTNMIELHVMDVALRLLQTLSAQSSPPPVWFCTMEVQPFSSTGMPSHAGVWGLVRTCRQELAKLPAWCIDVQSGAQAMHMLIQSHALRLPGGSVRGLQLKVSLEPEVACSTTTLHVPRLVTPYDAQRSPLEIDFEALRERIDRHASAAMAGLDVERMLPAFILLDTLCRQYLQDATHGVKEAQIPLWHHKLVHAWFASQTPSSPDDKGITPADVCAAHACTTAEVQLAESCGPQLADALSGSVAYQELLFPGGSLELARPVYEDGVAASFYNGCAVAAVEAVLSLLPGGSQIVAVEVGAGTGGTASSVLPVLKGSCKRYDFTDVSEVFLRQARVRFADFPFLDYVLLNIDADPRLQGFALHQHDMLISTNCLHATPFMRSTLRHCSQLLSKGGMLVVNELMTESAHAQITFGLTDGWFLFGESQDPERVGQCCPCLAWRQWQALLIDNGLGRTHCMQGDSFLRLQGVIIAQADGALPSSATSALPASGVHLISGGLGGLGLLTARCLLESGARQLVLSSLSSRVLAGSEQNWTQLDKYRGDLRRLRFDVSDDGAVCATVRTLLSDGLRLIGIFHTAEALADASFARLTAFNFRATFGAQAQGAKALHSTTRSLPLRFFNALSSTAGLMGPPGQAPHSAACTWLEAMAAWRCRTGTYGLSVNCGGVVEVGYTSLRDDGKPKAPEQDGFSQLMAITALRSALLLGYRSFAVMSPDWSKCLSDHEAYGFCAPYLHLKDQYKLSTQTSTPCATEIQSTVTHAISLDAVLEMVKFVSGSLVDADAALMEAGIDSLAAVELRNQLQSATGEGITLPSTLIFDFPSARQLAQHVNPPAATCAIKLDAILEVVAGLSSSFVDADAALMEAGIDSLAAVELRNWLQSATGEGITLPSTLVFDHPTTRQLAEVFQREMNQTYASFHGVSSYHISQHEKTANALRGASALLPAVDSMTTLWTCAASNLDVISEVPVERWQVTEETKGLPAGFLAGATLFDATAFAISAVEARSMDPQQRLLLERSYQALHDAMLCRASLVDTTVGVAVAVGQDGFGSLLSADVAMGAYAATGSALVVPIASGRISYSLGLRGPCISVDTACSSSLVACHVMSDTLPLPEITDSVAAGVNMILLPNLSLILAASGMMSARGRCHSFDQRADGYGRSEACCAATLSDSSASRSFDISCDTAIRQDGKSASLTAPNGMAQRRLLATTVSIAGLATSDYSILEAHGTGTALGDPQEVGAIVSVFGAAIDVTSMKSNVAHTEMGAGLTGVLKLLTLEVQKCVAPNAQLRILNQHVGIAMQNAACGFPVQLSGCPDDGTISHMSSVGGVSSFGFSGTIAHMTMCHMRKDSGKDSPPPRSFLGYKRRAFPWAMMLSSASAHVTTAPHRTFTSSVTAEATVVEVVRELTGAPPTTVLAADTQLIEAGIDSLAATELASQLRTLSGVELSLTIAFEHPTPRALAAHLVDRVSGTSSLSVTPADAHTESPGTVGTTYSRERPTRIDECLWRVNPGLEAPTLLPLFGAPSISGSGELFVRLAQHLSSALYYLEHPSLFTGARDVDMSESLSCYADAIWSECARQSWLTYALIGTSFGGFMAHLIANASEAAGFPPQAVVLLDPPPLVIRAPPEQARISKQVATFAFLKMQTATLMEMSASESGHLDNDDKAFEEEVSSWQDDELAVRATEHLAQANLRQFSAEAVLRVGQQIRAFAEGIDFFTAVSRTNACPGTLPARRWETFLMLSERRVPFFTADTLTTEEEASVEAARRCYGNVSLEIVSSQSGGSHFAEVVTCSMGDNKEFVAALRRFLEPRPSAKVQSNGGARATRMMHALMSAQRARLADA